MISVRIKYAKGESVKYVSHLDTLKTFTRAARRADLPLKYSQGFNPHPHMVFGLPSSVGMMSVCECSDSDIGVKQPFVIWGYTYANDIYVHPDYIQVLYISLDN